MNILKRNNLNDEYNYLPDNLTVGTFEFWKRKFGDKFDDSTYMSWEAQSKLDDVEKSKVLEKIQIHNQTYISKLLLELDERNNENIISTDIIENDEFKSSKLSNNSE
jgi:hypothetical protein